MDHASMGQHCGTICSASNCEVSFTDEPHFKFWLPHFLFSSLHPERAVEESPCPSAPATHTGGRGGSPASCFEPGSAPVAVIIWEISQQWKALPFLCNSGFKANLKIFKEEKHHALFIKLYHHLSITNMTMRYHWANSFHSIGRVLASIYSLAIDFHFCWGSDWQSGEKGPDRWIPATHREDSVWFLASGWSLARHHC